MKNKNIFVVLLCGVVCVLAVAYAAFSTNLNIDVNTQITSDWDVRITSVSCSVTPASGGVGGQSAGINGSITETTANFKMGLIQPGDKAVCVATVTNNGNINAKLTNIELVTSGEAPILYSVSPVNSELAARNILTAGGDTEVVEVTGIYDTTVESQPASTLKYVAVKLTYKQVV